MSLRTALAPLPAAKLVEELSIRIYEPPLSNARERLAETPDALRIPILILDFDTEVCMNGMLGFLENTTGLWLRETIDAFEKIGAQETAAILNEVQAILVRHDISPAKLRSDFADCQPYQISTFRELHGDLGTLPTEVEHAADKLYLNAEPGTGEPVWSLLASFVERNRAGLFGEIDALADE
jgi:hypothetical protein